MVTSSLIASVSACAVCAALEGVCAGSGVRAFFTTLRAPKYSAPLPVWYAIGVMYYLTFGFVLYRLLSLPQTDTLIRLALALVAAMMLANALWNLVFFRARNLFVACITGAAAPILDVALFICLLRLERTAALALVPYLLYRVYAVWWGFALWTANRPA